MLIKLRIKWTVCFPLQHAEMTMRGRSNGFKIFFFYFICFVMFTDREREFFLINKVITDVEDNK